MIKQELFILWDEKDGYQKNKIYLDYESADIGLHENYTNYWINNGKAKVEKIYAVSYTKHNSIIP